jgi:hypothetical protein
MLGKEEQFPLLEAALLHLGRFFCAAEGKTGTRSAHTHGKSSQSSS